MDDIGEVFDREQDQKKAQALLGIATNDYLGTIDRKGYDAPPPIPCEDWHTNHVWIIKMFPIVHTVVHACHLYGVTGKNEEATIPLEHLASIVKLETPETYKTGAAYLYVMKSLALRFAASNQDEKAAGLSIEPFNISTSVENADTIDFNATFVDRGGLYEDHECEKAEAPRYADYDMDTAAKIQAYDKLHEYLLDELLQ
ncbi:MAG: hypothetical protein ASARMPRED_003923 [Alectoria sarmentosa]|nr:MAG: hypothetical protein ASARMPRED_003923 [Alectoria sarmentosa]